MPKITGKYETVFIVNATLSEEAIKALVEKFTNLISARDHQGRGVGQAPHGLCHRRYARGLLCPGRV